MDFQSCKVAVFALLSCSIIFSVLDSAFAYRPNGPLQVGFYQTTCPPAEAIVRNVVYQAIAKDRGAAADLIRLFFHDCFVRGCDASVLLDSIPGVPSEKESPPNKNSLEGFEVIDAAKAQLEAACPGTVSCADIVAFAARDSAVKAGNIYWDVPAGRRDGRVSLMNEPLKNLPSPFSDANTLIANFAKKGMSADEMVTLSGAHSIGHSHCGIISSRLYPQPDPSMDPAYAAFLRNMCPPPSNSTGSDPEPFLDPLTPFRLDNKYYIDLKNHRGLFTSDQTLLSSPLTSKMVLSNAKYGSVWAHKFAAAMVHLGNIDVLTGRRGEIRKNCHFRN